MAKFEESITEILIVIRSLFLLCNSAVPACDNWRFQVKPPHEPVPVGLTEVRSQTDSSYERTQDLVIGRVIARSSVEKRRGSVESLVHVLILTNVQRLQL